MSEIEDKRVCKGCGREVGKRYGVFPKNCPYCGGRIAKKVVVR